MPASQILDTQGKPIIANSDGSLNAQVTGTVTATQSGTWIVELKDGSGNIVKVFDVDTSGVTHEYVLGTTLRISGSGGSIEAKGQKVMSTSIPVVVASDQSTLPVQQGATASASASLQNAAGATGLGTAIPVLGHATVAFTVSGTFVGTITFEGSEDSTNGTNGNWNTLDVYTQGSGNVITAAQTPGTYRANCAGLQYVRAHITQWTSGTITVTAHAVPVAMSVYQLNANVRPLQQNVDHVTPHGFEGNATDGFDTLPSGGASTAVNTWPVGVMPNPTGGTAGFGLRGWAQALTGYFQAIGTSGSTSAGQNALLTAGGFQTLPTATVTGTTAGTVAQLGTSGDVGNYRFVSIHITSIGVGATVTFQCTARPDLGSSWTNCPLLPASTPASNPTTTVTTATNTGVYYGSIPARYFRVVVVQSSGTTVVDGTFWPYSSPYHSSNMTIEDGTNTAFVLKGDGTYQGQGALLTASSFYAPAQLTATSATSFGAQSLGNYRFVAVQLSGTWVGTVKFQCSLDGVNWLPLALADTRNLASSAQQGATINGVYVGMCPGPAFRLSTAPADGGVYTSGTIVANEFFSATPSFPSSMGVSAAQVGSWVVGVNDGTNTANVVKGDGTTPTGQAALMTVPGGLPLTGTQTSSGAGTGGVLIGPQDAINYNWITVQMTGHQTGTGYTATVQGSTDGVSGWSTIPLSPGGSLFAPAALSVASVGLWSGPLPYRYVRINIGGTSLTGTTSGFVVLRAMGAAPLTGLSGSMKVIDASGANNLVVNSDGSVNSRVFDGTNTANVLASTTSGNNAQLTAPGGLQLTASSTSASGGVLIASQDCLNYSSFSFSVSAVQTGLTSIKVEGSQDGVTNWTTIPLDPILNVYTPSTVAAITATGNWQGGVSLRYIRVNVVGAAMTGTTTATLTLRGAASPIATGLSGTVKIVDAGSANNLAINSDGSVNSRVFDGTTTAKVTTNGALNVMPLGDNLTASFAFPASASTQGPWITSQYRDWYIDITVTAWTSGQAIIQPQYLDNNNTAYNLGDPIVVSGTGQYSLEIGPGLMGANAVARALRNKVQLVLTGTWGSVTGTISSEGK